jgi:outer membrane protein TolC
MLRITVNTHHHKRLIHLGFICTFMTLFSGCITVGPDYKQPTISLAPAWNSQLKSGLITEERDSKTIGTWWATINDPELSGLIDRAMTGNLDLKKARARVREARAQRGVTGASLFPTLDVGGYATWSRTDKDTGSGRTSELYSASFDAGWELDIFGGVRRSVEAAEADLQASKEDFHDVLVSLLAEIALNYV